MDPRQYLAAPVLLAGLFSLAPIPSRAVAPPANFEEALAGTYTLPDPLTMQDGSPVKTAADWTTKRRPELLELFEEHVYGHPPALWGTLQFEVLEVLENALDGKATRKRVRIFLKEHPEWTGIEVLLYLPKTGNKKVPCFVGLNFNGNHAATVEADVPISTNWMRDTQANPPRNKPPQSPDTTRGSEHSRWLPEKLIAAGFGLATAYYGDIEPDYAGGWKVGIRGALSPQGVATEWKANEWGGIGAWAWGLSRILDYLESDPAVDAQKCAVIGHSRLGKTALWAGARDERFSIVLANDSGEGGAALMRRNYGETVAIITGAFPHWFAGRWSSYANRETECPVDQHELVALVAPRPVAVGSAVEDRWADPLGEFLSAKNAGAVYQLFGKKGLESELQPAVGESIGNSIGYHLRAGKHDLTEEDWGQYIKFCARHWPG